MRGQMSWRQSHERNGAEAVGKPLQEKLSMYFLIVLSLSEGKIRLAEI